MRRTTATHAVATVVLIAAVGTLTALGAPASALVGRGSAGAPLTISFKDAKGTTTTTVTIAADGTYKADFGISSFDDYTATIKKSDGSTLAAIPITVTQAAEPCITPSAGTGAIRQARAIFGIAVSDRSSRGFSVSSARAAGK